MKNLFSTLKTTALALFILSTVISCSFADNKELTSLKPTTSSEKVDGYQGIWYDLGQSSEYGSKYSGGLGTYTAKHRPLAFYSPEANKTFFVYGGKSQGEDYHLQAMASYYDHQTGMVPKPTLVHDKKGTNDPHDDPSIWVDENGYVWIFVSGRAKVRLGYIYKSTTPYDTSEFEQIQELEYTYPQPIWTKGKGFFLAFTRYNPGRKLFWMKSDMKANWTQPQKLADMDGHYQMTSGHKGKIITAFNMHPRGTVDLRTNLYYLQTTDQGDTWQTITGETITPPLTDPNCSALVYNYREQKQLIYLKDISFDKNGNPVLLYIVSNHHQPGPKAHPRTWTIAHWDNSQWKFHSITTSNHNYDMGSLYIEENNTWKVIAPTEPGPQPYGTGGEVAIWTSTNKGQDWTKTQQVTSFSQRNHTYVRRPENAHPDFYAYWADGNPNEKSISCFYFTNISGDKVWQLPYNMTEEMAAPRLYFQNGLPVLTD